MVSLPRPCAATGRQHPCVVRIVASLGEPGARGPSILKVAGGVIILSLRDTFRGA